MKLVTLDSEEVVIANVDGEYFAFNNTCPHEGGPLAEGELEGDIVPAPGTPRRSTSGPARLRRAASPTAPSPPTTSASKGTTFRLQNLKRPMPYCRPTR
jgi:hypothetical protein